ncbi:hypothetical protein TMatcc_003779 [Talaromyces marneffei ATCC 18224]|uniref:Survival Motor Neuron Gemin2-binding domain-containing protein n=2 Tax=Talaromyces marneffei TaxID=37727 RepID=B6Q237_TALMQ|nr:uncharacterized protein EYB26_001216 [Talaromyces marneffei]EEA27919.1 conserved hypothetical protein [Talaromyces marneffei ATCC 18224]KAE8556416.1 hypothetical protein EYB25_001117 [Talaromyces marneffei]QGA13566.1 hypothetical protein EYB26_001216 [Talaromyces marneffei]
MAKRKHKSGANLSHEEIWDDTALVRSWDEAVEEYNLYHSIHARGENVEEVLDRAEREGVDAVVAGMEKLHESMDVEEDGDAAAPENVQEGTTKADEPQVQTGPSISAGAVPPATGGASTAPDALLGQVQDPALKNLMMAWYYAGYYTGLYEGRQQASQSDNASGQI